MRFARDVAFYEQQRLRQQIARLQRELTNAEERLRLAREALLADGYFQPHEVSDDIAPRIIERLAAPKPQEEAPEGIHYIWYIHNIIGDFFFTAQVHACLAYGTNEVWLLTEDGWVPSRIKVEITGIHPPIPGAMRWAPEGDPEDLDLVDEEIRAAEEDRYE